ncbi:MAG: DUF7065 domain-containing protein [Candidatus Helarchaeota archaeon]
MINEIDENLHDYPKKKNWRESYYYNFMDEKNNIFGVCTYGIMPNEMEAHYLVSIWINNKLLFFPEHRKISDFTLNPFQEMKMEFKKPLKEIVMDYSNQKRKFKLEFIFKGRSPIYKYKGWKFEDILEQEHYEQSGEIIGKITVKDIVYNFSGLGQRDHSWGVRDWVNIDHWSWISAQFSNWIINCWIVEIQGKKRYDGFISKNGKIIELRSVQIKNFMKNGDKVPESSEITIETLESDKIILKSNKKYHLILPQTSKEGYAEIFETISEFKSNLSNEKGYGVVEYLKKF